MMGLKERSRKSSGKGVVAMRIGQLLGVGNTANVFEWGTSEVIKIFHLEENAREEAMKEARNAEIVDRLSIKAPRFSGLTEYEGKTCLIYEKIEGQTMLSSIEPTESSVSDCAKLMAQLHIELHEVQTDVQSNLRTQLSANVIHSEVMTEPEKVIVLDMLETLPEEQTLCHYDFHPGNIILSPNGPIIIDWMNALVGHRLADVARTYMMIDSRAVPPHAPAWLTNRALRVLFAEAYLGEYERISGMDRGTLEEWFVPTFAARIRELRGEEQAEIVTRLRSAIQKG
ncbi:phosphotransferase family protein [Paenibacillus aurantiacus]|uniref:Phosphotransferase family protein n=1 Tax=Paenibacillus aurantiacus TaxID=1936118 RepID=A0ABV5KN98_9BACL